MFYLDLAGFNLNLSSGYRNLEYKTSIFPGGEVFFRLKDDILNEEVVIASRLNSSEEIMRLMMAVDALKRAGAISIRCFIPYLPYQQQDRVCSPGESHSLKVISDLINSMNLDVVSVLDPHSSVCEATINNLFVITNEAFINEVLKDLKVTNLNVVVPDAGAAKKISSLQRVFEENKVNVNLVECSKQRDLSSSKIVKTVVPYIDNDWDILIVDDLCLAGGTFMRIMDEIDKQKTANSRTLNYSAYLATTHGIYNEGFGKLDEYFDKLYCTNSWKDVKHPIVKQFQV